MFRRAFGFGELETAGVNELVVMPWQSEEHSSDGDVDPDEREKCRGDWGVGPKTLEVRPLTWRSRKVSIINATSCALLIHQYHAAHDAVHCTRRVRMFCA